jgi:holin-like protein
MRIRRLILSFSILFTFYAAGEAIVWLFDLAFPGAIIGMLLLAISLLRGWVNIRYVESAANLLLSQLGLLFVPPAVGILLYFDLLANDWLPLAAGTVGSLAAVLCTTAWTANRIMRQTEAKGD